MSNKKSTGRRKDLTFQAQPESSVSILDPAGLSGLLGITPSALKTRRSRDPAGLPPPFICKPLRWRLTAVLEWMESQEKNALERATLISRRQAAPSREARQLEKQIHAQN